MFMRKEGNGQRSRKTKVGGVHWLGINRDVDRPGTEAKLTLGMTDLSTFYIERMTQQDLYALRSEINKFLAFDLKMGEGA